MIRKRLNRNIDASAIVDLPEVNDELQQVKNDVATNTQDITTLKGQVATNTEAIEQLEQEANNHYTKPEADAKFATIQKVDENSAKIAQNEQEIGNLETTTTTKFGELDNQIEQIEQEIGQRYTKQESDEKFATKTQIDEANTQIGQNQESIGQNTQNITTLQTQITNTPKLNANNTFSSGDQFYNGDITLLKNKKIALGWNQNDIKLRLTVSATTKESFVVNPQGTLYIQAPNGIIQFSTRSSNGYIDFANNPLGNVANPNQPTDAANKRYVDNKIPYYKTITTQFTRQVLEANKVVKYYSRDITRASIDSACNGIISIALQQIPSAGQHLVVTFYSGSSSQNALVEIYQYQSNTDITNALNSTPLQVVYTKG